jgi:diguanylate cyclase (GGDEF)-like protein/PAS domain S-box-containing protein
MNLKKWTRNLPIRSRLLYGYLLIFLLVILIGNSIIYLFVRSTINKDIATELSSSTLANRLIIKTAINNSIIDQLQVVVERNLEIIIGIYQEDLKEVEAKKRAVKILASQSIGKTGFLYVVNSNGDIQVHPDTDLIGKSITIENNRGHKIQPKYGYYLEHQPKDQQTENWASGKAHYRTYFGPWDWIISAAISEDDFSSHLDLDELRKSILANQFGETGFSFVMDTKGNLVIHPKREGQNIFNQEDSSGKKFIQEICKIQKGAMTYRWQSPGEPDSRIAQVYFDYVPELDWIVVSIGYLDEFYSPLTTLRSFILGIIILLSILIIGLTWQISKTITRPIKHLTLGLKAASKGDFTKRLSPKSLDELGQLENHFNTFLAQLQMSNTKLHESEKGFRSIFENSVEGIFQFDIDGNILKVNPSFVSMLGYNNSQALLDQKVNFYRDLIVRKELCNKIMETLIGERTVKGFEVQLYRKSGVVFWCLLNARGVHKTNSDEISHIEGFLADINDRKLAQESQEKILEDLEVMVGKRTAELSHQISELEQRNQMNRYMGEMADMMQSCRSISETFPIIKQYLKILFPADTCTLYLHDETRQLLDQVVPPVSGSETFSSMTNDSCWALRQGKNYLFHEMDQDMSCEHVAEAPHGYLCIPLIAQGVTTGLLHIVFHSPNDTPLDNAATLQDRKTSLCSRLADHLSLAFANLKLQEELKLKSIQDSLTGLANRRHMEEILQRQFHRLMRYETQCSLIMLDVDHFKNFNDTYGHEMGDFVLQELGGYLKKNTRGEDLACRFGGEEFIIIMVNTSTERAFDKAEKIRAEIAETLSIPHLSGTIHFTVSCGVATAPAHGRNIKELLKSVDTALYQAKHNGRNRVEVAKSADTAQGNLLSNEQQE